MTGWDIVGGLHLAYMPCSGKLFWCACACQVASCCTVIQNSCVKDRGLLSQQGRNHPQYAWHYSEGVLCNICDLVCWCAALDCFLVMLPVAIGSGRGRWRQQLRQHAVAAAAPAPGLQPPLAGARHCSTVWWCGGLCPQWGPG